ncbi:MAG: hypothetical protein KAV87_26585, partial [Desulfobacteraceae bacterium]|nr:hypothetical protein [Desulfobacteraceae bacterium]
GESELTAYNDVILVVKKSEDYAEKPNDIIIPELMAYARDILPPHEVPEKITFVEIFPVTSGGEIDKKALHEKFFDNRLSIYLIKDE